MKLILLLDCSRSSLSFMGPSI